MENRSSLVQTFTAGAEAVAAVVSPVSDMKQALAYAVEVCAKREPRDALMPSGEAPAGEQQHKKVIAAPKLEAADAAELEGLCEARGMRLVREGLHEHVAGIEVGFTIADYGIAETGTMVIDSSSEELRLATMISEVHVGVMPVSRLRATSLELSTELSRAMGAAAPSYYAFITGASRTADIERVLAMGVHGPLELHILLLDG